MFSINRFLLIFAVLALIQCRPPGVEYNAPSRSYNQPVTDLDFDKIKERGYLIALMDNSTTGMFMYRGKPMGYEYELLKMYTDSMGIGLRVQVVTNIDRAIEMLNNGEGDVLAYNLTVTRKRKERIAFTHWHNQARQVLVQRKPANWRTMKLHELEPRLIRNPIELIGKEVYVRYQSAHLDRLVNLSNEIGGEILIVQDFPNVETEELIQKVADGIIDYTIAEEDIARLNAVYHPELDVNTAISFPQQMAWGVRKNSKGLLVSINSWLTEMRSEPDFHTIYNKYYKSSLSSQRRKNSDFSSLGGGKLSPYDSLLFDLAQSLGWDWRLLAAQVYKESHFNPNAISAAGAVGLLQIVPETGRLYGVEDLTNPVENLRAARYHIQFLQDFWSGEIEDEEERYLFILASYNAGHGHVNDARRLAAKNDRDPDKWSHVAEYLLKLADPVYYNDPVVTYGYCRGSEPVRYVEVIMETYHNYMNVFSEESIIAETGDINLPLS